ncbi:MAG: hypothetical protein F6K26_53275 [Moorea sp. SIO2I5]|nr:hypothetical protein [Moorena sp. SIO2I5]
MGILVERASWWNGHLARLLDFRMGCPNPRYEEQNQGEPVGGALRGGLSQHWRP